MKSIRIGLLGRIIIAIALGILFGNFLPEVMVRIFVTFNGIFSEFLGFIIPLIILGLVTPAIADIGSQAGRMLVVTTLVAYTATLISGYILSGYDYSRSLYPRNQSSTRCHSILFGIHPCIYECDDCTRHVVHLRYRFGIFE